jgi:hypothetical protein
MGGKCFFAWLFLFVLFECEGVKKDRESKVKSRDVKEEGPTMLLYLLLESEKETGLA